MKSEVKTPLSFMFKVVPWLIAALIAILYAPVGDSFKLHILWVVFGTITFIVLIVFLFAWFKPTNLVYGESGHRAERKMEFGTESGIITRQELERLPGSSDPKKLKFEKD